MISLLLDQNVEDQIAHGLRRRFPEIDLLFAPEAGVERAPDDVLLRWCAENDRVLLTDDVRTLPRDAYQMIRSGETIRGVLILGESVSIGRAVAYVAAAITALGPEEYRDRVIFLPY